MPVAFTSVCHSLTAHAASRNRSYYQPRLRMRNRAWSRLPGYTNGRRSWGPVSSPGLDPPHHAAPSVGTRCVCEDRRRAWGCRGAAVGGPCQGGGHAASFRVCAVRAQRTARSVAPSQEQSSERTWTGSNVPHHKSPPATADFGLSKVREVSFILSLSQ